MHEGESEVVTRLILLPEVRSWSSWLTVNFLGNATTDLWGRTYSYEVWPDSFWIRSDDPDRPRGNEDDIGVTKHHPF